MNKSNIFFYIKRLFFVLMIIFLLSSIFSFVLGTTDYNLWGIFPRLLFVIFLFLSFLFLEIDFNKKNNSKIEEEKTDSCSCKKPTFTRVVDTNYNPTCGTCGKTLK